MAKKDEALILEDEKVEAPEVQEAPELEIEEAPIEEAPKKASKKSKKPQYDAINVYNGKMFVRQYSLAIHGEKFAELAAVFAKDRGFGVEGVNFKEMITCPHCGNEFDA